MTFDLVEDIATPRLALIAVTTDSIEAEAAGVGELAKAVRARVPETWPPEHWDRKVLEFLRDRFAADASDVGWHRYIALREDGGTRTLIGTVGGFRRPEKPGECEIGYSVVVGYRELGYATEAAQAFVRWALSHASIEDIVAQTFPSLPASIRVMEKCGMTFVGAGYEEGTVLYRRARS
jgi:[ribosomal protein S5]-alanine N-acetyltransferase